MEKSMNRKYFYEALKYIKDSKDLVKEESREKWEEYIIDSIQSPLYRGFYIKKAIDIMQAIETHPDMSTVDNLIKEQDHSGASYGIVCSLVINFYKHGKKFAKYVNLDFENENSPECR